MRTFAIVAGIAVVLVVGWDAFETVLLPRRVVRRLRLSSIFLGSLWRVWAWVGRKVPARMRESYLSLYALLGLLMLFALWSGAVIAGCALVYVGLTPGFNFPHGVSGYGGDLYVSGTTFFTLGLGDVIPASTAARTLIVLEAGAGLGFLALVISYLPVLYQAFSRRELEISVLDEWAGTPPSGVELVRRAGQDGSLESVTEVLTEWEHWAADVLESHVSFPMLAFFRSQHENQSWLSALTSILDLSVLGILGVPGVNRAQARRTFAMARHAVVDLSQVLGAPPLRPTPDMKGRTDIRLADIAVMLRQAGVGIEVNVIKEQRFAGLRSAYEPYVEALSRRLLMPLPTLASNEDARDNWVRSPWEV